MTLLSLCDAVSIPPHFLVIDVCESLPISEISVTAIRSESIEWSLFTVFTITSSRSLLQFFLFQLLFNSLSD